MTTYFFAGLSPPVIAQTGCSPPCLDAGGLIGNQASQAYEWSRSVAVPVLGLMLIAGVLAILFRRF